VVAFLLDGIRSMNSATEMAIIYNTCSRYLSFPYFPSYSSERSVTKPYLPAAMTPPEVNSSREARTKHTSEIFGRKEFSRNNTAACIWNTAGVRFSHLRSSRISVFPLLVDREMRHCLLPLTSFPLPKNSAVLTPPYLPLSSHPEFCKYGI
jgi:hypothetical protein